jgi:hypothetical protein
MSLTFKAFDDLSANLAVEQGERLLFIDLKGKGDLKTRG